MGVKFSDGSGSGQFFVARVKSAIFGLDLGLKISPKNPKFFNFLLFVSKKIKFAQYQFAQWNGSCNTPVRPIWIWTFINEKETCPAGLGRGKNASEFGCVRLGMVSINARLAKRGGRVGWDKWGEMCKRQC